MASSSASNDATARKVSGRGAAGTPASNALMRGAGLVPAMVRHHLSRPGADALENISKASLARIAVSQLPKQKPDFRASGLTKDVLVTQYLTDFIVGGLASGQLTESMLLPRKQDIAKFLGVSVGTVQNAIRVIEDLGHVESKQRIGTIVRKSDEQPQRMRKLTSKRDRAIVAVKKFILDRKLEVGQPMPSAREISAAIGSATNTTRLAMEYLTNEGVLSSRHTRGNTYNWELIQLPTWDEGDDAGLGISATTLIDQLERDLKGMIAAEFDVHTKLPPHLDLAERFKVSIKTVHDAMKRLNDQGIVASKRGRYGTFIVRKPDTAVYDEAANLFVAVDDPRFYNYEKVEHHLKQLIAATYTIGDRLPAMMELAEKLNVSSNTIRRALQNLSDEGIVRFTRGRFGGTFVEKQPLGKATDSAALQWVSVRSDATQHAYQRNE